MNLHNKVSVFDIKLTRQGFGATYLIMRLSRAMEAKDGKLDIKI